jgi:hypothetical protein
MYMFGYLYNNNDNIYLWLMLGVAALLSPSLYTYMYIHTVYMPDVKVEEWIHNTQSVFSLLYIINRGSLLAYNRYGAVSCIQDLQ